VWWVAVCVLCVVSSFVLCVVYGGEGRDEAGCRIVACEQLFQLLVERFAHSHPHPPSHSTHRKHTHTHTPIHYTHQGDTSDDDLEYSTAPKRRSSDAAHQRPGSGGADNAASGSDDGSSSGSDDGSGTAGAGAVGRSLEKPSSVALKAAEALSRGQSAAGAAFERALVGDGGAGYGWPLGDDAVKYAALSSIAPPAVRCGVSSSFQGGGDQGGGVWCLCASK